MTKDRIVIDRDETSAALIIENGSIKVPVSVLDDTNENKLKKVLETVLTHKGCLTQEYIYGMVRRDCPVFWQTLIINGENCDQLMKITDPGYVEPTLGQFATSMKESVGHIAFSKHHCAYLDKPLDDMGNDLHNFDILLTPDEDNEAPPTNSTKLQIYTNAVEKDMIYPDAFPQSRTKQYAIYLETKESSPQQLMWHEQAKRLDRFGSLDNTNYLRLEDDSDIDLLNTSTEQLQLE